MTSFQDPAYRDSIGSDRAFFSALFARRIPEVANGAIRVVDAVRDPGRYAKVAVTATVGGFNAASTCIGQRGVRVHEVEALIPGERISVVMSSTRSPSRLSRPTLCPPPHAISASSCPSTVSPQPSGATRAMCVWPEI
ncbi:hypothetical protein [Mycobacteroides abscessus]|uniref:hypothetical protein n=1 Tax=Mycobacteroides abscessus TaxID=36809 RepID=UPI0034E88A54